MGRYVCVHGHFSQPPRESPWLDSVELDDTAYPYHDWNERMTAECYAPNAVARILDEQGLITRIINNYARLSFDFAPRLLGWLAERAPDTYRAILAADRESRARFAGHGTALAAPYASPVLPLLGDRDRRTLVHWGIRDFRERFGRAPEGLWLPEMAVDVPTLETVAGQGIGFVLLAAGQAARVRDIAGGDWQEVSAERLDVSRGYLVRLPSGRSLGVLFQHPQLSDAVAFHGLLADGTRFANSLVQMLPERPGPAVVAVITDGETYGHHHRHGDMALAYALELLDAGHGAELTLPGLYLQQHPPAHEVEVVPRSSSTCPHGLGRWSEACGCSGGAHRGWDQRWRARLREGLGQLHESLARLFEERAASLFQEPWAARDAYIQVILDRSPQNVQRFLERQAGRQLAAGDRVRALQLLEMQRQSLQMMASSRGWAADDVSDPDAVQLIRYAARAVQLCRAATEADLEPELLHALAAVPSNRPELRTAARLYERRVRPASVDLAQVCAHYAISSLLERHPERARIFNHVAERLQEQRAEAGAAKTVLGRVRVTSSVTSESATFAFGVLHLGGHNVSAGVRQLAPLPGPARSEGEATPSPDDDTAQAELNARVVEATGRGDLAEVVRLLDAYFGGLSYSAQSLFADARRSFMEATLESTLAEDAAIFRQLYDRRAPVMRLLTTLGAPLPRALHAAAEFVINQELRQAFNDPELDRGAVEALLQSAETWLVALDTAGLAYILGRTIERATAQIRERPGDQHRLETLEKLVDLARGLPFKVDFWSAQNIYHESARSVLPDMLERADEGDPAAQQWVDSFPRVGEKLGVRVSEPQRGRPAPTVAAAIRQALAPARVPRATYRLQFSERFTFREAREIVPYLDALGVSDLYLAPVFQARRGSTHGYDLCDPGKLNEALGGEVAFQELAAAAREQGMGIILDTVPNHMGIGDEANQWWMDVLENGPSSAYASYFDIEWNPVKPELANKVLLPILEDQYGRVLEHGKLRLVFEEGAFCLYYYSLKLPLAPHTYSAILELRLPALSETLGEDSEHVQEYRSILTAISYLPPRTERDPVRLAERNREKEVIKRRILALYQGVPEVAAAIDAAVSAFNGRQGDPASFDLLDNLIGAQAFRPAYWRVAAEEINYRRFFDINDLAAVRTEDPAVFRATHALVLRLLAEGAVTGLRIDHIDGLYDPERYLRQLQESYLEHQVTRYLLEARRAVPDPATLASRVARAFAGSRRADHPRSGPLPLYVVVEKILGHDEMLPPRWAAHGTTGYDFLNQVNALLVDARHRRSFDEIYGWFTGSQLDYADQVNTSKKMTMLVSMASEVLALGHRLERLAERNRRYRDFTLGNLTFALREVIAALPVYRTYISEADVVSERDQRYIEAAVAEASRRNPRTARAVFDFIRETLLLRNLFDFHPDHRPLLIEWVRKFQQVTGPVMAKGAEDTAFYRYNRLISLNEVGGEPDQFGSSIEFFHARCQERQRSWPHSMLASSTHDTKRGEDTRARINVLSEMPAELRAALERWRDLNAGKKIGPAGQKGASGNGRAEPAPDANDEYLLYQSLIGAWPFELLDGSVPEPAGAWRSFRERVAAYMQKAIREAKVHTSWVNPNQAYDEGVQAFVQRLLAGEPGDAFIADMRAFLPPVVTCGVYNSLSQTLLKLTAPGVPDLYQGSELWNFSLVDPDNRRPVDYAARRHALERLVRRVAEAEPRGELPDLLGQMLQAPADGAVKLYVIWRLLGLRKERPTLFANGSYQPLAVEGPGAGHLCAFERELEGEGSLLVLAPRMYFSLTGGGRRLPLGAGAWDETRLVLGGPPPGKPYREVLSGQLLPAGERSGRGVLQVDRVLQWFPVAALFLEE